MSDVWVKVAIGISVVLVVFLAERFRLRHLWKRRCTGALWRRRFPQVPKQDIRDFLAILSSAFAFRDSRLLCFAPTDQIMSIYRALYPFPQLVGDAMELETFAEGIRERFGVDLVRDWRDDFTLGELFTACQRPDRGL